MEIAESHIIYIHGLPGSHHEVKISKANSISPFGVQHFEKQFDDTKHYKIIAFSLGAMTAIEIAAKYSSHIDQLVLISPAAPLELGDFLPHMDGRFVFKAARTNALLFWLLTYSQSIMAKFTPNFLMHKMFGESCSKELALLKQKEFVETFQIGLKQSLGCKSKQYRELVTRYTQPWQKLITQVTCPVQIWHGTKDTWAPYAMGLALDEKFQHQCECELIPCDDMGHYSALQHAIPLILENHPVGN